MPICPRCRDEYEADRATCAECDVPLVPADASLPPRVDALLGTFHPAAAGPVAALLERRGIAHEVLPLDGDRVEILADRRYRDDVRAELVLDWAGVVTSLPEDERSAVRAAGGAQPGWFDAPRGAWVDAAGRLQVDRTEQEELEADAQRTLGPALAVLGAVLLIFGWWGGSAVAVVLGIGLVGIGVLLPR